MYLKRSHRSTILGMCKGVFTESRRGHPPVKDASARQRPRNPLPRYLRITGATVCLLTLFFLQYAESNHSASPLCPLLVLQQPQHRAMFHSVGCLRESSSICSQLARLLRLRAPILNLSLQYTQDLSLRATCLTTGSGMSYLVAFLRTRDGIPHLFVILTTTQQAFH